jgi:hypothetical protein
LTDPDKEAYDVMVTVENSNGKIIAERYVLVLVNYKNDPQPDTDKDSCPAAPAVAAKILKELGIKHKYAGGNYIKDVAQAMTKGAQFPLYVKTGDTWVNPEGKLIAKTDVDLYKTAVYNFLDMKSAFNQTAVEKVKGYDKEKKNEKPEKEAKAPQGKGKAK